MFEALTVTIQVGGVLGIILAVLLHIRQRQKQEVPFKEEYVVPINIPKHWDSFH